MPPPLLEVRPARECQYDLVALGEVMLRLDPGDVRIRTARSFTVSEGGGEYNVARALRKCFGQRTAIVTALVDNDIGRLIEDHIMQGGVDVSFIRWVGFDGIGHDVRNGLNFTERGFGVRAAVGVSDRGHTAASQMRPNDVDWDHLFGTLGVRWFHTGGVYAGLSSTTPDVVEAAAAAAKRHGTIVSYDVNYRPSLWQRSGGWARAQEVNRRLARHVDMMIGIGEGLTDPLGSRVAETDARAAATGPERFEEVVGTLRHEFPDLRVIATTLRTVTTATRNDWGAIAWSPNTGFVEATHRPGLEIFDRVGAGDGFASGLIYGLMEKGELGQAVEYGAAHGALAMTTPGDTSMASLAEVELLIRGAAAHVRR